MPAVGGIQILWTAGGRRYPDTTDPERLVHDTSQRKIGEVGEISGYRRPAAVHGIRISPTAGISNYPNIILNSVVPTPWYLFPASQDRKVSENAECWDVRCPNMVMFLQVQLFINNL